MRRSGTSGLHDKSPGEWRGHPGPREWKHMTAGFKSMTGRRILPALILLICMISLLHRMRDQARNSASQISVPTLWFNGHSTGWRSSCATRSPNWLAPRGSNGYLVVRCNGGLNQQRTAICNAVLAARIMNATLVLPHLDTNSFWHDESGFPGIYDVEHFIDSLKSDVRVIHTLPATWAIGTKRMKLKPYQLQPPRDAPVRWYETTALETMKKHGAVYLTPFSHRLDEKLDNHEYQRLRCRVNYHALRFNNDIRNLSSIIVQRLRSVGPYMAIHLRFELDMLAFAGCLDIFTPEEQEILKKYRKENFAEKKLEYNHRRLIGKCPLTPHEVGLFLRAMGFNNATRIYLAVGEVFGGERFLKPLRDLFPQLETRSTVALPEELGLVRADGHGLLGPAVDYMVCLLSDIFVPTYDGPSNFANNLIGQRLYYGFRTTLQPDRKALAPHYIKLEKGLVSRSDFETSVRQIISPKSFGRPRTRLPSESFYTNPWPECFCMISSKDSANQCPLDIVETTSVDIDEDENFLDEWNQLQRL
ncbi:rhamnogalacturonan I rhamnosyltransferase [Marchantia polymorpha subsp. ruderalis]|uniref:O-fucosyltransferase family protein n=2 Tax=Marchantia polymorpha TaxID=3197 RepID=A0AAF6AZV7_MARPO|nr:hypothetical protein MARPO_0037s0008 [Marchantia polymorpha]BBN05289.1 hypothetical protein Mp_3g11890 [Marchantia polymorpha subsp. ruderalis]PTQ40815.1 hypothetical protein MARPO_0037s0008 [Marchantia polymorpha]PTQ40818.1 hypothetical protein MARPO_0037s0008 [Marchantia polymorpha]BBN05290.1 hypothetical protein Mp_3g11890 [Marchantia polymorpha subsp. ruderalis]|eukprot:PTQ40813.1 hypothetical protein MARPO_0037s0008 [Marchantia polymorpha]